IHMFRTADASEDAEDLDITDIKPPKGGEFENVYLVDRHNIDRCPCVIRYDCGAFTGDSKELQNVERDLDLQATPEFTGNWLYEPGNAGEPVFKARIKCSAVLIGYMDSASPEVGCAEVYVDGEKVLEIDPHKIGWQHCNVYIAKRGGPTKERDVEIRMAENDKDKRFTFLGFGVVD
nr:SGNH/GDSL hydrolase family protein [Lachnospiraceae bacterium]